MHTTAHLEEALHQKEQALIQYIRYMREAQDSNNQDIAALFADLAKAEEKHIAVIRDQVVNLSGSEERLNKYQGVNQYNSQHSTYMNNPEGAVNHPVNVTEREAAFQENSEYVYSPS